MFHPQDFLVQLSSELLAIRVAFAQLLEMCRRKGFAGHPRIAGYCIKSGYIALSFNIRPDEAIVSRTISMIPPHRREEWIIRQARERPTAEYGVFLDRACASDEALRQRLEARLAAHDQPETLMASQADTARPIKLDLADAPDEAVGQTLGRYKLLERIGEGGYGLVYVADRSRLLTLYE